MSSALFVRAIEADGSRGIESPESTKVVEQGSWARMRHRRLLGRFTAAGKPLRSAQDVAPPGSIMHGRKA